ARRQLVGGEFGRHIVYVGRNFSPWQDASYAVSEPPSETPIDLPNVVTPSKPHDVLVVGGGINGTGIARDAAGRGLSVLLCEQDDLAAHTSSASTKLIHGGLRYLEYYEFGLVRKSL